MSSIGPRLRPLGLHHRGAGSVIGPVCLGCYALDLIALDPKPPQLLSEKAPHCVDTPPSPCSAELEVEKNAFPTLSHLAVHKISKDPN